MKKILPEIVSSLCEGNSLCSAGERAQAGFARPYAAIPEIGRGHDKIVTIENPLEYRLPGVPRIPVKRNEGPAFARGQRSMRRTGTRLRHEIAADVAGSGQTTRREIDRVASVA